MLEFGNAQKKEVPLAEKLRPTDPDFVVGQDHIWGKNGMLRQMVERDNFSGVILWGPSGCGKTTIARMIGKMTQRNVVELSATSCGVKDIRQAIALSEEARKSGLKAHMLFLDEIHRLSRNQQDVLLPALEKGSIKMIGATTENPGFEVNPAVQSRCLIFPLQPISFDCLQNYMKETAQKLGVGMTEEAASALAKAARGDLRQALLLLEPLLNGQGSITVESIKKLLQNTDRLIGHDKDRDQHYDCVSALIKSIRASDPDAAIYYLARMIEGGETVEFIGRRLMIAASEEVGNANPNALVLAQSGFEAARQVGWPEARIILAQVVTYLAGTVKSNRSYLAIGRACELVKKTGNLPVPLHLRNAVTSLAKSMGYADGYVYAHDDQQKAVLKNNLPDPLNGSSFYEPSDVGAESKIKQHLEFLRYGGTHPKD